MGDCKVPPNLVAAMSNAERKLCSLTTLDHRSTSQLDGRKEVQAQRTIDEKMQLPGGKIDSNDERYRRKERRGEP